MGGIAALIGAVMLATPSLAYAAPPDIDYAAERRAIEQFQAKDQILQDIGWRLARGNVEFCTETIPSIGLQVQDLASYGAPQIARKALGLKGDFAVQTAASGSPSANLGAFPANREIVLTGSVAPNDWEAGERLDWRRLKRLHDHIDAQLAASGNITIGFADDTTVELSAVPVCATRFELASQGKVAVADGDRVVISMQFEGFEYSEDLLAAAIAHELAHNLLKHPEWLDRNGRKRGNIRKTEREADRLMPWLLANAGYDPIAAQRFFERYKPQSGEFLFFRGSHSNWKDRAKIAAAEVPRINALFESGDQADWATHFKREIDPQKGL